jgi:hypothetical protein
LRQPRRARRETVEQRAGRQGPEPIKRIIRHATIIRSAVASLMNSRTSSRRSCFCYRLSASRWGRPTMLS